MHRTVSQENHENQEIEKDRKNRNQVEKQAGKEV